MLFQMDKPIISYSNLLMNKSYILKKNHKKCGIYKWNNLITGKSYVGSSVNLGNRFKYYFSLSSISKYLIKKPSYIYRAIIKYGYNNFTLDILEYCEPDVVLKREQFYIDKYKPEYNILKIAGSRLGQTLSEESKRLISINSRKLWNKGSKGVSKEKLSVTSPIKVVTNETKIKLSIRSSGVKVKVFNKSGSFINEFSTIKNAAKYLNLEPKTLNRIFETGISYDDYVYKFEPKDTRIWICDENNKLINILKNMRATREYYNIPKSSLSDCIRLKKPYKNLYFFYNNKSKPEFFE